MSFLITRIPVLLTQKLLVNIVVDGNGYKTLRPKVLSVPSKHRKTCVEQGEFHNGSSDKESACNAGATGDAGMIPGSGRSPGGGNDNQPQYSCLELPGKCHGQRSQVGYCP